MAKVNDNYLKLPGSYLFSTVAKKAAAYTEANPDKEVIKMSIGDVTKPLAPAVIEAMHKAVDEMGTAEGFHGYGPEQGYDFLRNKIVEKDYARTVVKNNRIILLCIFNPRFKLFSCCRNTDWVIWETKINYINLFFRKLRHKSVFFLARHIYKIIPFTVCKVTCSACHSIRINVHRINRIANCNFIVNRENISDISAV